jgi:hypothetical protein
MSPHQTTALLPITEFAIWQVDDEWDIEYEDAEGKQPDPVADTGAAPSIAETPAANQDTHTTPVKRKQAPKEEPTPPVQRKRLRAKTKPIEAGFPASSSTDAAEQAPATSHTLTAGSSTDAAEQAPGTPTFS